MKERRLIQVMEKNITIDIPFNIDLSCYIAPSNPIYTKLKEVYEKTQTRAWLATRLDIFMAYTVRSLKAQTNQDFRCFVRCTETSLPTIKILLGSYEALPSNIQFTTDATALMEESLQRYGWLYRVVMDSDNMYASHFIEQLHKYQHDEATQSIICRRGYIYDEKTKRLAMIKHPAPSFYVAIYNMTTYKSLYQKRLFEDHWDVLKYPYEYMDTQCYCICMHETNVDNTFEQLLRHYKGQEIEGIMKQVLMKEWQLGTR